jgi:RNase adaptor protein for sRNA GlmZ degradation
LHRRLENSFVYDPENRGYFFRRNMPKEIRAQNFQDEPLWRTFNYELITAIYKKYNGYLIVPMTIYDKNYFEEIIGKLRRNNIEIEHYLLGASKETLLKRLSKRLEKKDSWAAQKIDTCIQGFKELMGESIYIDTNALTIYDVADTIAKKSKLPLKEDRDGKIMKKLKRAIIQIRHINFLRAVP